MALVMTAAPAVEPVSVAEAKAHLRIDHDDEDALISSLIITSRLHVEAALGLALISQGWSVRLDAWPADGDVVLPIRPVQSVSSVKVTRSDGAVETLSSSGYVADGDGNPAQLHPTGGVWPQPGTTARGIEIELTAGFGDTADAVPSPIRQALLMLVAHWYEQREPVAVGTTATRIPETVSTLLAPYRTVRL